MRYAVEMDLGAMVYIPSFIKIVSTKVDKRDTQTAR
jgi:hypothetical protein